MKTFKAGDSVSYKSLCGNRWFHGHIVGFYGKDRDGAVCTDQTGLPSRPVHISRLEPATITYWHTGTSA